MKFVHFTAPDGSDVAIHFDGDVILRQAKVKNGDPAEARTVIVTMCGAQSVRETMAEVEEKMR